MELTLVKLNTTTRVRSANVLCSSKRTTLRPLANAFDINNVVKSPQRDEITGRGPVSGTLAIHMTNTLVQLTIVACKTLITAGERRAYKPSASDNIVKNAPLHWKGKNFINYEVLSFVKCWFLPIPIEIHSQRNKTGRKCDGIMFTVIKTSTLFRKYYRITRLDDIELMAWANERSKTIEIHEMRQPAISNANTIFFLAPFPFCLLAKVFCSKNSTHFHTDNLYSVGWNLLPLTDKTSR